MLWGLPARFGEMAAHHGFLMLVPFQGEAKRRLRAPLALAITGPLAGALALVGRKATDLIKSGGFKIGAGEIENALLDQPSVSDNKKTVKALLDEAGVTVTRFARFEVGQA